MNKPNEQNKLQVPEGYKLNSKGGFDPISAIRAIDLARDDLVNELVQSATQVSNLLSEFKLSAMADISAFVQLSAEEYGAKIGGNKGNITLISYDGKYKIQRAISEYIQFDERLQAAKGLIDECITEWVKDSRPELQVLIDNAFQVDKEGKINTGRVLSLRRLEIKDSRWQSAMTAIGDSLTVTGSKSYIRIYKQQPNGEYKALALDIANA